MLQDIGYCLIGIAVFFILIFVLAFRQAYKQNKANSEAQTGMRIKPSVHRFIFSWYMYSLFFVVPALLLLWFLPGIGKRGVSLFISIMPVLWLLASLPAFPYYVLVVDKDKINGATLSGIIWKRIEINVDEIDREKVLKQSITRRLGITVIHSTSGKKILTLGLDDSQVMSIIEPSKRIVA